MCIKSCSQTTALTQNFPLILEGYPFLNHESVIIFLIWRISFEIISISLQVHVVVIASTHLVMKQELWFLGIVNSSKTAQSVLSEASVFRGKWPT